MYGTIIQIQEIIKPSEQGLSRPYVCRGEDGLQYYVKGRNSTRPSQCYEWICAHLGKAFGLNIPDVALVEISPELLAETPAHLRDVGAGIAFGSHECPMAQWFEPGYVSRVPEKLRRDVAVFDWWIRNDDRTSGNTNLLLDQQGNLVVIDHNAAFSSGFISHEFQEFHIFADSFAAVLSDFVEQENYANRLSAALELWDGICHNVPAEWFWVNDERDIRANFNLDIMRQQLDHCISPEFWRMV